MTTTDTRHDPFDLRLDAGHLTKGVINAVRVLLGITGAAALVLGILALVWPDKTVAAAALIFGIYFMISGVVRLGLGIFSRGVAAGTRVLNILMGILLLIGGVIAVRNVGLTAVVLLVMVAVVFGMGTIIEGVLTLVESGQARSKVWAIIFGVLSIIAGILVLTLPFATAVLLLFFCAVTLIVLGIVQLVRAFTFGREVLKTLR